MSAALDLKKIVNGIQKRISQSLSAQQMNKFGNMIVGEIKDRTRQGRGVYDGNERNFPRLSQKYIDRRKKMRLSPFTSPSKSNITRTGKLLASIRYTTGTGKILIRPVGNRSDTALSNAELADIMQTKLNRPFMKLSNKQIARLKIAFRKSIL